MAEEITPPTKEISKLYEIELAKIETDPLQPRKSMDAQALAGLTRSIAELGVLEPVLVRPGQGEMWVLVAGTRRLAAARQAGLTKIPALIQGNNHLEIAMVENLLREELTAIEEAEGVNVIMNEKHYSQEQLATILGKAQNTLSEILSLNKLPQEIRDECRGDRTISRAKLVAIARKKQERSMRSAYQAYKESLAQADIPRPKPNPNEAQKFFDLLARAVNKIQALDTQGWSDGDRGLLESSLLGCKEEIDKYLARRAAPPAA